jgi:hypothetical protein
MPYKDRAAQAEYMRNWREGLRKSKDSRVTGVTEGLQRDYANQMKPSILIVNSQFVDLLKDLRRGLIEMNQWVNVELDKIQKEIEG